jgi:hypothetical protein
MKIIVSTKTFENQIRRALNNKTTAFEVNVNKEQLICIGKQKICFPIRIAIGCLANDDRGTFDPIVWYQIMMFLKHLEEQPIVIEISGGNEPSFELMQFIKRF